MKPKHISPAYLRPDLKNEEKWMRQTEKSANSLTSFRSDIVMETHARLHRISQVNLFVN